MTVTEQFERKSDAIAACKAAGYTVDDGVGRSGDFPNGSRLYFSKPDSPRNQYGAPLQSAIVSYVSGAWRFTAFVFDAGVGQ